MDEVLLTRMVLASGWYLLLGFVFALAFTLFGVGKLDPAARKGSWGFRLLIIPGVTFFWPLFALRWLRGVSVPPLEKNAHRRAATESAGGRKSR